MLTVLMSLTSCSKCVAELLISSLGHQRLSEGFELEPVAEVGPVGSFPGRGLWGIRAGVSVP